MPRKYWKRVPASRQPKHRGGRIIQAFQHTCGATLSHWLPGSRSAEMAGRTGAWLLEYKGQPIVMKTHYGRSMNKPPLRWATTMLRHHFGKEYSILCGAKTDYPSEPAIGGLIAHPMVGPKAMPPLMTWVPPPPKPRDPMEATPPIGFASRPMKRMVRGKFARQVLFPNEYDLYVQTWNTWVASQPDFVYGERRADLEIICLEIVLQFRLDLIDARSDQEVSKFERLFSASLWRIQRARLRLGATHRQRLQAEGRL